MAKNKLRDQFPTEEEYREYMRTIGKRGGQAKVPKGRYHRIRRKRAKTLQVLSED